jgi:hypothetical protein
MQPSTVCPAGLAPPLWRCENRCSRDLPNRLSSRGPSPA